MEEEVYYDILHGSTVLLCICLENSTNIGAVYKVHRRHIRCHLKLEKHHITRGWGNTILIAQNFSSCTPGIQMMRNHRKLPEGNKRDPR